MRLALAVALLIALAAPAGAQTADRHAEQGARHFEAGELAEALAEFRAAYELDPQPDYLYAMATIEEKRGECPAAVELYRRFIATGPPAEDIAATREAIERCGGTVEPPPPPDGEVEPPPPVERRFITRQVPRAFYRDVLGDALVVGGVVAVVASTAFYVSGRGLIDAAEEPGISRDEYEARWADGRGRHRWAAIAGAAGVTLGALGVVRWLTTDRYETVTVAADGETVGVVATGRF